MMAAPPRPDSREAHGQFSLRTIALAVLAESDSEDRDQIVKEIEHRIPKKELAEALRQALPAFVHQVTPRWIPPAAELQAGQLNSGRSSKVAAIRETWRRHLEGRYSVEDGSLRRVGDLTYGDLLFVADRLEAQARSNFARAAAMKTLAAKVAEFEVERVRDLPHSVLSAFFSGGERP